MAPVSARATRIATLCDELRTSQPRITGALRDDPPPPATPAVRTWYQTPAQHTFSVPAPLDTWTAPTKR